MFRKWIISKLLAALQINEQLQKIEKASELHNDSDFIEALAKLIDLGYDIQPLINAWR